MIYLRTKRTYAGAILAGSEATACPNRVGRKRVRPGTPKIQRGPRKTGFKSYATNSGMSMPLLLSVNARMQSDSAFMGKALLYNT